MAVTGITKGDCLFQLEVTSSWSPVASTNNLLSNHFSMYVHVDTVSCVHMEVASSQNLECLDETLASKCAPYSLEVLMEGVRTVVE